MELEALPVFDAQGLEPLVSDYLYNDYRHYRAISKEVQIRILISEIERAAEQGQLLALRGGDQIVGLVTLSHLPWDSSIFGLPMAKIGHLIVASAQGSRSQNLRPSPRWADRIGPYRRDQASLHPCGLCRYRGDPMPGAPGLPADGVLDHLRVSAEAGYPPAY